MTSPVGDIAVDRRAVVPLLGRLRAPEGLAEPFPVWNEIRSLGEAVPTPWGGWLLTGFDVCNQVLRGRDWLVPDFAWQARQPDTERWQAPATQEMSRTLSRLNPPMHTHQRRGIGNLFDRAALTRLGPMVDGHTTHLLDELAERLARGPADFVRPVGEMLPIATIGDWLGIPPEDHRYLVELTHDQAHAQELLPNKSQLALSEEATRQLRGYFTQLIAERRTATGEDVLSSWIRTWDELEPDRESADEILYTLTMFVTVAALETTTTLLSTVVWRLLQDPARWDWLRRNPEHIDSALDEALRYDPPIQLNTRIAAVDTELAGIPLAKDTMVHVMYGAANHDPRANDNPGDFDILRGGNHLTFGGGIHYCLGAQLARLEARALLGQLLERFPTLHTPGAPHYASRMVFRRIISLELAV